jgi:Zn-dependent peptidase ImmA (M78 family)
MIGSQILRYDIPKELSIMGETIKVKVVDDLSSRRDAFGECHARYNEILINRNKNKDIMSHTFFHELTHMILAKMNETELYENEKFINVFSGLMYQALKTQWGNAE